MKKLALILLVFHLSGLLSAQVSPQTGSAVFNLPIFQWNDDKSRLTSSLSLDYSSGTGLKVTDLASNFGQGWSFTGGGVISRMQVGLPDDQIKYEPSFDNPRKYPPGILYNSKSAADGCPLYLTKYPIYPDINHIYTQHTNVGADRELDYFSFEFNGKRGLFVLGKNQGNTGFSLSDAKMKIRFETNTGNPSQGIRTSITAFHITDIDGLTYTFSQMEITHILKYKYWDPKSGREKTQPQFDNGTVGYEGAFVDNDMYASEMINSWYLKEVRDSLTGRAITFNYTTPSITAKAGVLFTNYDGDGKNYSIVSYSTSKTETPQLSSIIYPDGHQVLIGYGKDRADLPGAKAVAYIDVKYQSRYLSKYDLTTSYFIRNRYGNPTSSFEINSARLCLVNVRKYGPDLRGMEEPYTFDYYMGSTGDDFVPPPFFYARDIWGYYNGNKSRAWTSTSNTIDLTKDVSDLSNNEIRGLCFQRQGAAAELLNSKTGYAKNGLIKQIIYPTGSVLKYEYAQNSFDFGSGAKEVAGVHVSRTSLSDGGFSNNCGNPVITNYTYNAASGSTVSSLWGLEMPENFTAINSFYEPKVKKFKWKFPLTLSCDFNYKFPGILSRDQGISLPSNSEWMRALSTVMNVVSGISTVMDIINICMAATTTAIIAVVVDAVATIYLIVRTCFNDDSKDETINTYTNSDIHSANPLPSQFKRVEVMEGSGSNGKTATVYTSPDDLAVWESTNPYQAMFQRFAFWAYGLPKAITLYSAAGYKVHETINTYNFITQAADSAGSNNFESCKCQVLKSYSIPGPDWSNPANYDAAYVTNTTANADLKAKTYGMTSGHAELVATEERVFKPNSSTDFLATTTNYTYNPDNLQLSKVQTSASNGDITFKYIFYPTDFPMGVLNTLISHHILNVPVSTYSTILKVGFPHLEMLHETVTEFATAAGGDVKPYRTLEQRFIQPQFGINVYRGPGSSLNPTYVETQSNIYDGSGNVSGTKDEGNRVVTNLYDYSDKYVVASVVNCAPLVDKAAYTSFETPALGGWTLSGATGYNSTSAVTGTVSFNLTGSNSLSAPLNTAKSYTVSFWSTTGSITVSGGTLVKSAPLINGFTYYEYRINQGASSVTVGGSGRIDELRLYPATARMRTVAYDPLIGKTAECDENNRVTYYDYEELGRLRYVKDENRNVMKMYEYNYAINKPDGCNTVYYNNAISENFPRNNCSVGYIGSNVSYTVPASKYSSTVSQSAADILAEMELLVTAQIYANSHGSCIRVYSNAAIDSNFTKQGCDAGSVGNIVGYHVPEGLYTSTISQADADQKAMAEMISNGQAAANNNGSCSITTEPDWEVDGEPQYKCETIGVGSPMNTGNQLVLVRDINPHSTTYNQTDWKSIGVNATACPAPPQVNITYINQLGRKVFVIIRNQATGIQYAFEMQPNKSTTTFLGTVPVGTYTIERVGPNGPSNYLSFGTLEQTTIDTDLYASSYYIGSDILTTAH